MFNVPSALLPVCRWRDLGNRRLEKSSGLRQPFSHVQRKYCFATTAQVVRELFTRISSHNKLVDPRSMEMLE